MTITDFLSRLDGVRGHGGQYMAKCPAHPDSKPSLSIGLGGDNRILLKCQAGCAVEDILDALELTKRDLFAEVTPGDAFPDYGGQKRTERPPVVATYTYPSGVQKLRRADKSFIWRQPDKRHGWIWNRKGVPHELYVAGELTGAVFVCEGEKDADTLHKLGYDAASGEDGAGPGKWRKEYTKQLNGLHVCVFQDNDQVGKDYAAETCNALHGVAASVRLLDLSKVWPEIPEHGDVTDLVEMLGAEAAAKQIAALITNTSEWVPTAPPAESEAHKPDQRPHVISAQELQEKDLPPIKFLVDGILPVGTAMISAPSKIGKSWMVLNMGLSIAAGGHFMGHGTNRGGVLYLALEDSENRLQDRMNKVLGRDNAPTGFYFMTEAPTLDNGLLDMLDGHIKEHPDTSIIIIDTLQKVRGQALPREQAYAQDYREMGTIKAHMDKKGVAVFFVHHNRKMKDEDDPFNMISGTTGIMGAADTIWVITKDKRGDGSAVLHITGRDVESSDTVIQFNKNTWKWEAVGDADQIAEQRARDEYESSLIVKTIRKLLEQSPEGRWDGTAKDLMEAGKYIARTYLAPTAQKLGHEIKALDGPLFEYDGIIHRTPSNGTGGKKHSFYYQSIPQFEDLPNEQVPFPNM